MIASSLFSIKTMQLPPFLRVLLLLLLAFGWFAPTANADNWALVIGIDRYEDSTHINQLGGADADAKALAKRWWVAWESPGRI
jgi:hypothetical protein